MSAELRARVSELEGLLNDACDRADEEEKERREANSREDDLTDMNDSLRTEVENLKGTLEKILDLARDVL